jgi:hypothetical protein
MLHPERGDSLTELEKYLWRFRMAANEAQVLLRGFHNTPDVARDINADLLFSLCNQGTLIVAKFLEIWDPFGSLMKHDARVLKVRIVAQPIVDRMRVWTGLEQFRNTAVAHPYLRKNGELIGPWELLSLHKAPSFHAEVVLLLALIDRAALIVLSGFPAEYAAIRSLLQSPLPAPEDGPGIRLGTDIQAEQDRVLALVKPLVVANQLPIAPDIAAEFDHARTRPSRE